MSKASHEYAAQQHEPAAPAAEQHADSRQPVRQARVPAPGSAEQLARLAAQSPAHAARAARAMQRRHGNAAIARVQAKLVVTAPGDRYEQEADQAAAQAARMPLETAPPNAVQRAALSPVSAGVAADAGLSVTPEVEAGIEAARGSGQPLPESVRGHMEAALGADLGGVRVHADAHAHALNEALEARAFTTGRDIFFRKGEYQPGSTGGREILAHELAHVVQQRSTNELSSAGQVVQRLVYADPNTGKWHSDLIPDEVFDTAEQARARERELQPAQLNPTFSPVEPRQLANDLPAPTPATELPKLQVVSAPAATPAARGRSNAMAPAPAAATPAARQRSNAMASDQPHRILNTVFDVEGNTFDTANLATFHSQIQQAPTHILNQLRSKLADAVMRHDDLGALLNFTALEYVLFEIEQQRAAREHPGLLRRAQDLASSALEHTQSAVARIPGLPASVTHAAGQAASAGAAIVRERAEQLSAGIMATGASVLQVVEGRPDIALIAAIRQNSGQLPDRGAKLLELARRYQAERERWENELAQFPARRDMASSPIVPIEAQHAILNMLFNRLKRLHLELENRLNEIEELMLSSQSPALAALRDVVTQERRAIRGIWANFKF